MTRPIRDLDVPLPTLRQQIEEIAASTDPRVGLNPTGRPRRSSAASRRRHARRNARTNPNTKETS